MSVPNSDEGTYAVVLFIYTYFVPVLSQHFRTGKEGTIDSWNGVGINYGIESVMSHKMLIFKPGIDFVLGS
jgi:hypothetical protein